MDFYAILDQVIALLRQRPLVPHRRLDPGMLCPDGKRAGPPCAGHRYRAVSCYEHDLLAASGRGGAGAGGGAELKGLLPGITKVILRP
jgi:hypothetical protein